MKPLRTLQSALSRRFRLTTLQQMILAAAGMMLVICSIFLGLFSAVYRNNIREIVSDEMHSSVLRTSEYLDLMLTNAQFVSSAMINNSVLQGILAPKGSGEAPLHANADFRAFYNLFSMVSSSNQFIDGIDIYIRPRQTLLMSNLAATAMLGTEMTDYLDRLTDRLGDMAGTGFSLDYRKTVGTLYTQSTDAVTILQPLISLNTGKKSGFIAVNIQPDTIRPILQAAEGAECVLLDENSRMLVNSLGDPDSRHLFEGDRFRLSLPPTDGASYQRHQGREYILAAATIRPVGWRLVSFTPTDKLIHKGNSFQPYLILLSVITFLLLAAVVLGMMQLIRRRIRGLIRMMDHVEGGDFDLDGKIRDQPADEFSYLFTSFNAMVKQVDRMINELYRLDLKHKDVQLRLLQNQVKPHFLYNIFNNMHWLIRLERFSDLDTLVQAVSVFYSRSLNDGRHLICVGDTLEKLESYVQIQQIRFPDRFRFEVRLDEDLRTVELLNHLIQPLLENAIIHGIEPLTGQYRIELSLRRRAADRILISVRDNGAGIPPQRLEGIRESLLKTEVQGDCFALQNIHHRIQIFYGRDFGLSLESQPGQGTTAEILIPYPKEAFLSGMLFRSQEEETAGPAHSPAQTLRRDPHDVPNDDRRR